MMGLDRHPDLTPALSAPKRGGEGARSGQKDENGHYAPGVAAAVFYAPFYVALARGAYAEEGVEVRFVSSPTPGQAAQGLFDGSVDVCWGGPMRVMETYQQRADCDLVCFAEVVTRDPFLLVGREARPSFQMADLVGMRIGRVSEVPTPWLCLQEDLRRAGVAPAGVDLAADRSMAENCAALRDGTLDVVQLFEPFVSRLVADGVGHVWYAAATRGATSYTTFYCRRGLLIRRRDELRRMVRAMFRVQKWLATASDAAVAEAIADYFPHVPPPVLSAAAARYLALGIWGYDPYLRRTGYDRLRAGLVSGGLVDPGTPYETAVDNSIAEAVTAEAVTAEDPPALS
jgi:NitT/TauT family transport system substrate-binding protein